MCLDEEVLLQVEWAPDELKDITLKEHTQRFKKAVEKCKSSVGKSKPDMDSKRIAGMCFASVTKTFKSAGYPIFMSDNKEVELEMSEGIFKIQLISHVEPVIQKLQLPIDAETLYTMLSDDLKKELFELIKKEKDD